MSMWIYPKDDGSPEATLATLKKAITDGETTTWTFSGGRFKYTPSQWANTVDFEPKLKENHVHFTPHAGSGNTSKTYDEAYTYVHGRFFEFLMTHGGPHDRIGGKDGR